MRHCPAISGSEVVMMREVEEEERGALNPFLFLFSFATDSAPMSHLARWGRRWVAEN